MGNGWGPSGNLSYFGPATPPHPDLTPGVVPFATICPESCLSKPVCNTPESDQDDYIRFVWDLAGVTSQVPYNVSCASIAQNRHCRATNTGYEDLACPFSCRESIQAAVDAN